MLMCFAENWFTVDEKRPIAFAKVEILEANDMKPSDLNGETSVCCLQYMPHTESS